MSVDHVNTDGAIRRKRPVLVTFLLPLLAFLAGLAAMGWLLSQWDAAAAYLGIAPPPVVQQPAAVLRLPAAPAPAPATAEMPSGPTQRLVIDPETTRRVNRLEQRLTEIAQQSSSAAGNADRAEGLLVAFAARRALDRGVGLGYIEGLLSQRFGDTQRPAVATIITAARQPVTLEELQAGLKEAGPELVGGGPDQDWWAALKHELAGLVIVRRAGAPSTLPSERLERARRRLDAGQVDVALAEVLRMPGQQSASEWIGKARRYVSARRALDTIETAALLDPLNPPQPAAAGQARLSAAPRQPSA
ncbi:MAG TPA: hypothetical protein VF631_13520 [Allosphingosinicella sp.]|jgi:DNA-binding transcriptional regulator YdaS (Cro superfamily)|uniref:hypothetical protein n=1 Tax=Allosphingosinicella sp. TaxID=2823234 RepID=UPI002F28B661